MAEQPIIILSDSESANPERSSGRGSTAIAIPGAEMTADKAMPERPIAMSQNRDEEKTNSAPGTSLPVVTEKRQRDNESATSPLKRPRVTEVVPDESLPKMAVNTKLTFHRAVDSSDGGDRRDSAETNEKRLKPDEKREDTGPDGSDVKQAASVPAQDPSEIQKLSDAVRENSLPSPPVGTTVAEDSSAPNDTKAQSEAVQTPNVNANEGKSEPELEQESEGSDIEKDSFDLAQMRNFEHAQVSKLNPRQLRRYELFRRSDLKNSKIKKILAGLNPALGKVPDPYVIAVKGLAKVFVGDVVESALEVQKERGDSGPLQPKHLREAYRRLRTAGAVPHPNDESRAIY